MKKIIAASFILVAFAIGAAAQTESIVWETDFKKAQQAARETGRPLLLDFTAEWCKPCKTMDREFWVREDVIRAVKPFVAVKVDFDSEKGLVGKYKVSAIPFVIFTDPLGNTITFRRGFSKKNADELNTIFNEMPKDFSPMLKYYDALDLKKDDGIALFQVANAYRGAKMLQLSNEFYKKAFKTPEIQADAEKKTNVFLSLGVNYLNLGDYTQALEVMEDFLKTNPTGEPRETALYFLTLGSAYKKKLKDAEKYLRAMQTEFPGSKNIQTAAAAIENVKSQSKKKD